MPLRIRLIASLAGALALTLVFACALMGLHAAQSVRTELTTALAVGTQTVRNGLSALPDPVGRGRELKRLVGAFDGDRHLQASLLDGGFVLAQSRLLTSAPAVPRWFRTPITPKLSASDMAVSTGDLGSVTVRLQADPTNEIGEVWGEFRDAALALALFCVLTTLTVSWTLDRALRPVTNLLAGLSRIGADDYSTRLAEAGPPEIAALAGSFNSMAARLAEVQGRNTRLQEQLLTLQEEERADLSRELHDEVGPYLFAASMAAAAIQHLAEAGRAVGIRPQALAIQDSVSHVQRHVRDLLSRLRPLRAIEFGLGPAVDELVTFWRKRVPDVVFSVTIKGDESALEDAIKETIYRTVQESLSNAMRHGRPKRVCVTVACEGGHALLRITDDGAGADGAAAQARPGFGLAGMKERVSALGGTLAAGADARGPGWVVMARLPIPARAQLPAATA